MLHGSVVATAKSRWKSSLQPFSWGPVSRPASIQNFYSFALIRKTPFNVNLKKCPGILVYLQTRLLTEVVLLPLLHDHLFCMCVCVHVQSSTICMYTSCVVVPFGNFIPKSTDDSLLSDTITKKLYSYSNVVQPQVNITGGRRLEELETLMLNCTSSPSTSILWLKRDDEGSVKKIFATTRISISTARMPEDVVSDEMRSVAHSTLTIRYVTEFDSGDYICAAEGDMKTLFHAVNFTVYINGKR